MEEAILDKIQQAVNTIDRVSNSQQYPTDMIYAAMNTQSAPASMDMAVSMLEKSMDTQSIALTQFLQQLGIGNNIDASC